MRRSRVRSPSTPPRFFPAQQIKRAARGNERPVSFTAATYFELDPVLPEPVLDPMPLEPLVLPAPDGLLLLGDALEPLEDDEPCSCRQRSFSAPVLVSHCVLPPRAGELLEELPVA